MAKKNYESILEQVKNSQSPLDKYGIRKFMIGQLEDSIKADCEHDMSDPKKETGEEYKTRLIEYAKLSVDNHTEELEIATQKFLEEKK